MGNDGAGGVLQEEPPRRWPCCGWTMGEGCPMPLPRLAREGPRRVSCSGGWLLLCLLVWGRGLPKASAASGNPLGPSASPEFHATNVPQEMGSRGSDAFYPQIVSSRIEAPLNKQHWSSSSFLRPRMRVLDHPGTLLGLLLLLVAPGKPTTGSPQAKVDCICHNEDYVVCDWGSRQRPDRNYSFYFWYENDSKPSECKDYMQKDRLNVACQFSNCTLFMYLNMFLNDSQGQSVVPEALLLNNRVRAGKPFNLTFHNLSNHQLLLTWDTPYNIPNCLQHSVRYKSNKDTEFMEHSTVNSMKFNIPSVDPEKRYVFYVKSKLHIRCATTDLWSEESSPAFWGKEAVTSPLLSSPIKSIMIPLASCLFLMLMLVALLRMEKVWVVLMPRIPNPSRNFEELFTAYQGNFSEWAGVSKYMVESFKPNYYENICAITELLPSGGYLSASSETTAKSGGPPDPPPKASPDPAVLPT
ncbi:hypothetical protein E2320_013166 [Naja naja]|uniref:Fibronectin type-III domain-containing protein n=1 Tax=Naja naja TaxID=35670 RepID=A0A8C6XM78_NAJNA|nr:hypothetical protein E2320_013166 [Naja naja]